jgi:hypothetical protein
MAVRKLRLVHNVAPEGYRWIDKDPIIDEMMALAKQDGRSLSAIAVQAYLSPTTAHNWDKGKTRKPNHVSVQFFLRAMGYEMQIVKSGRPLPIYRWRKPKGGG